MQFEEFLIPWWIVFLAIAALLVAVVLLWRLMGRRPGEQRDKQAKRRIQVSRLEASGPPAEGPRLEFYGVPVRLAVLVLAPVGRQGVLPPKDKLPEVIDQLIPGFMEVVAAHKPLFHRWPEQLSSQGFTQAFFNDAPLPGDRGKGTPWCSIAGKFQAQGRQFLAGMVCCASSPNGLSQVVVEHEGLWLDVLRVRRQPT